MFFHLSPDCQPELHLTFDTDTNDVSGKSVHVKNVGVQVVNGVAFFHGNSWLIVQRFANAWFGRTAVVIVRYQSYASPSRQGLVCNGDCDVSPSLYVGTTADGSTEFYTKTYGSPAVNFTIPQTVSGTF